MTIPISQAEYSRRRGVSKEAVSKAIAQGRLRASTVMVDGHVKIADPELADEEWESTTRTATGMPRGELGGDIPDLAESIARRAAAAARKEAAQAELAELELAERKGSVVEVARVRADLIAKFTLVKTRILGVPARVAQRLPRIGAEVVSLIDDLLREALEELATDDGHAATDAA